MVAPNLHILSPSSDFLVKYNCRVKYFPDNQIKITCFSKPIFNPHQVERIGKDDEMAYKFIQKEYILNPFTNEFIPLSSFEEKRKRKKGEIRSDSMNRAIDRAFEIGCSNDFQYFITLTLDETKIDRSDTDLIYKKLYNFLHNAVKRKNMKYLIFPEYHKQHENEEKPAIHFHGLISADNLHLEDSGKQTESGQAIYNWSDWKYGFSTLIKLDGRSAVLRYVTKYITKGNAKIFGKFYFSGGKGLNRQVPTEYMNKDYQSFDGQEYKVPNAGMSVKYKTFNLDFDTDTGA